MRTYFLHKNICYVDGIERIFSRDFLLGHKKPLSNKLKETEGVRGAYCVNSSRQKSAILKNFSHFFHQSHKRRKHFLWNVFFERNLS